MTFDDDFVREVDQNQYRAVLFFEDDAQSVNRNTDYRCLRTADVQRTEEIREELAALKPELTVEYGVSELGIFGSYSRNEQTADSDLDVLVEFDEPVSLFELVRLENELATRLGEDVDVVTRSSLKPRIRARVADDVVYV